MSGEPCITYDAELVYEGESLGVTKNIVSPGVSVASGSGTSGFAGGRSPRVGMGSHIINDMVPNGLLERGDVGSVGIEVSDPNDRTVREAINFVQNSFAQGVGPGCRPGVGVSPRPSIRID